MKTCLLILPRQIHPILGGYAQKNAELIRVLNKHCKLTVVIISSQKISKEEQIFYTENTTNYKYFYFPKWRFFWNAGKAICSKKSILTNYFYFRSVQKFINQILAKQDVAIGVYSRTMQYFFNSKTKVKLICDLVDSHSYIYKNSKNKTNSWLWNMLYSIEAKRIERVEKMCFQCSSFVLLFSYDEYLYWKNNGYSNVKWIPHGVKESLLNREIQIQKTPKTIAFIGKMDYQPNVDAVLWFLKNVCAKLDPNYTFYIIGTKPTQAVIKKAKLLKNTVVTGFLEDPYTLMQKFSVVVAPMQTGGGIQNKVLEAMALGTLNIISPLAAKQMIGATENEHFLIAKTPEDYIKKISEINADPQKYQQIQVNAKKYIQNHFTWKHYETVLLEVVNSK